MLTKEPKKIGLHCNYQFIKAISMVNLGKKDKNFKFCFRNENAFGSSWNSD